MDQGRRVGGPESVGDEGSPPVDQVVRVGQDERSGRSRAGMADQHPGTRHDRGAMDVTPGEGQQDMEEGLGGEQVAHQPAEAALSVADRVGQHEREGEGDEEGGHGGQ